MKRLLSLRPAKALTKWVAKSKRLTKLVARFPFLTTLFFYLRGTFYLEQRRVLLGMQEYNDPNSISKNSPPFRLIRNTHRLEKALSMPEKKPVFAESYIKEIVDDLYLSIENHHIDHETIYWASDVTALYFKTVQKTPIVTMQEKRFLKLLKSTSYIPKDKVPHKRGHQKSSVAIDELSALATQRRSVRWFLPKQIPHNILDKAFKVAQLSPSACNRQAFSFRIFDDPKMVEKISSLPLGMSGYREQVPTIIVVTGKQRGYEEERDRHVIFIDASLAVMSFLLALETLGLGSSCANWGAIPRREKEISKLLRLDDDEQVVMLIAVGYPDPEGHIPYSQKRSLDIFRIYNQT